MNTLSDERLSSLQDGELDETQQRHALDALGQDDAARARWERYHLASDALHGNLPTGVDLQFSARVMAAIEDEPAILAPSSSGKPVSTSSPDSAATVTPIGRLSSAFNRRFAGLAVAASVAAVAVMGVDSLYQQDPAAPMTQQVASAPLPAADYARINQARMNQPPLAQATTVAARQGSLVVRQGDARRIDPRLHKYLINHSQRAARSNVQGVMPYARIVTYAGMHQQSVQR